MVDKKDKKTHKDKSQVEVSAPKSSRSTNSDGLHSVIWLAGLLISVFAFKSSVLDANNIPSASMIPTLKIGDYLFVNKMRYSFHIPFNGTRIISYDDPERGDIITFLPPREHEKNYVKRVIGMPGDRFRMRVLSVCDLPAEMRSNSPDGKPFRLPALAERDFRCPGLGEVADRFQPPHITIYEYREKGHGPWRNFGPRILPDSEARQVLTDADHVIKVLHPDLIPAWMSSEAYLPVLFEETINGTKHQFLELYDSFSRSPRSIHANYKLETVTPDCTPETMLEEGCEIPAQHYLVMGDNRDNSLDSRAIGLINRDLIRGKALIIYFSINWYRQTCNEIMSSVASLPGGLADLGQTAQGPDLEEFPSADQARYCDTVDSNENAGLIGSPLHFFTNMLIRKDVRWRRLGKILK